MLRLVRMRRKTHCVDLLSQKVGWQGRIRSIKSGCTCNHKILWVKYKFFKVLKCETIDFWGQNHKFLEDETMNFKTFQGYM